MATGFQDSLWIDIIKKCELISEGPPARYCLRTTRSNLENDGSVRKWTFGQRKNSMQKKVLLLVGETGTGKTTLINAIVNYILGVRFTDEVWFEITEKREDNLNKSTTQTVEVTMYEIFLQDNPICLTIIDTPGYGDTRGTEFDRQIAENLYKLFHNDTGVEEIDAVCLVVKSSVNRLSDRQQYIFDAVLSSFGKDIENNIVVFITYSDGIPPPDVFNAIKTAGMPCRKGEDDNPQHFLFNNRQTEKKNPKHKDSFQTAWKITESSLNGFFDLLNEQNTKRLEQTKGVLTESKRLEACISNLQDKIDFVECKREELIQNQKALNENKENIKRNKNFTFKVITYQKVQESTQNDRWSDRKVTSCSDCKENCHEHQCWCAWDASWCEVIKNKHCIVCTGKCHYTKHVRESKKYVISSKTTEMTINELKRQCESIDMSAANLQFDSKKYENVENDIASNQKLEEDLEMVKKQLNEQLTKAEKEKGDLVEEAYTTIIKLAEITLKPDSAFIVQALDFLIPRTEETGKKEYTVKLRELRKILPESQERVNVVLEYARPSFNKLNKHKNVMTGKK